MRKAKGSGFKMRSGNKTSFKMVGSSSPLKGPAVTPPPTPTTSSPASTPGAPPVDIFSGIKAEVANILAGGGSYDDLTPTQRIYGFTAEQKAARAAEQKAARQAEIDAFEAGGGLAAAENYDSETGTWNLTPENYEQIGNLMSVSTMYGGEKYLKDIDWGGGGNGGGNGGGGDDPATISNDLESEILEEVEAPDYDADEGSGSLYDYSVRKGKSAIRKRAPKKKSGFKMKRRK